VLQIINKKMSIIGYDLRRNRGMLEMIASILTTCLEGTKKTHIMYKANLTSTSLNEYLEFLLKNGLLERSELYRTTTKGRMYLEHFKEILTLLGKGGIVKITATAMHNYMLPSANKT
jgi:predicted transcriptional regulator